MSRRLLSTDYASLQAAVDAAAENDLVVVPAGHHQCASLRLKSNLTLRLEAGAVLHAPREIEGYNKSEMLQRQTSLDHYFFGGFGLENLCIEGEGVLACNGDAFWSDYDGKDSPPASELRSRVYLSMPSRPSAMLFVNCRNLRLRDFSIVNAAAYTVWCIGCQNLRLERLRIKNHRLGPNTDGLDIDCCQDVWIDSCHIDAGDDCIALKSDIAILGRELPCERVHISNCTLTSTCCALRLGYEGDGDIRDIIVNDCIIHDSNKGFELISVLQKIQRFNIYKGARIENVVFKGAVMRNVRQAIAVWSGADLTEDEERYQGYIRRLSFADLQIEAVDASFIGGMAVSEIMLNNIRMQVRRDAQRYKGQTLVRKPNVWGTGYLPYALNFHQVANPILNNVNVSMEEY